MLHCITFLQISLMSGLIKDSLILLSASTFSMLWFGILVEISEEYQSSQIVWKGRGIFNTLFRYLYLKISYSIESETILMNVLLSIILKCIGLNLFSNPWWNNWASICKVMNLNLCTVPQTKINLSWVRDLHIN